MSPASRAVFLSYASEDAEAARRICEALRAAGIEVWFDQSELRGEDVWDRQIRKQIHDCALFMPIISAHSQARLEGYFRREWKLAADRTHDMAEEKAFLVPVVIDGTSERDASVPERFREVQWTRLPAGETPPPFVERVRRLLSPEAASTSDHTRSASVSGAAATAGDRTVAPRGLLRRQPGMVYGAVAAVAAVAVLALGYLALERLTGSKPYAPGGASIAVLPLANESGEASQQYFSDGISPSHSGQTPEFASVSQRVSHPLVRAVVLVLRGRSRLATFAAADIESRSPQVIRRRQYRIPRIVRKVADPFP